MSRGGTRGFGRVCLCGTFLILAACSGSSSQKESEILSEGLILSGSVGDGPVVGADIRVLDARGSIVAGAISDTGARYQLAIPDGTPLPVTVIASGGTDLVTGRALDFELSAKALESHARELNLSPYTTLANQAADCRLDQSGETRTAALAASLNNIHRALNFGWDRAQQSDPIVDEITADNVAMVLLSNEALGELIRRTTAALAASATAMNADEVMRSLACDVADGQLDGAGPQVQPRVAMTALGAAIGVQLEVLAGELYVDGQDSTPLLDDALRTVAPQSQLSVQDAPIVDTQLQSLRAGISVMEGVSPRGEFRRLQQDLSGLTRENARARSRSALSTQTRMALTQLPEQTALASEQDIDALIERQVEVVQTAAPVLSFSADRVQLTSGQTARLSWASSNTEYCVATQGWTGERAAEGVFQTAALTTGTTFGLDCFGPGGSVSATVVVNVTGTTPIPVPEPTPAPPPPVPEPTPVPPPAQPTLSLQAAAQSVVSGSSTTLSWVSTNTTGCSASGAWSGNRNRNGTSTVGPLTSNATFNLSCTGAGGTVSDSVSVTVTPAPPPPTPSVSISASNGSITAGQSTTLSWASTNASSCAASGGWSGTRSTSGSLTVSPAATTAYTLTCSGTGGSRAGSVTVNVTAAPPPPPPAPQPTVTLGVSNPSIVAGNATTLNWSSTNATTCTAGGGWSGVRSTSGSANVSPTSSTSYTLTCSGSGGSRSATVAVTVTPAPAPQITFTSADSTVSSGGTTQLSWTSTNTTSCTASGGWSGSRSLSGNQMVGPLSATTTYSLSCSGPGGNVVRMLTVSMLGQVSLNWVAPAQNVDGSPLNDLAGFRIYYGISSRAYTDVVDISNPNATSFVLQQVQGDYYFAMTALDGDGNESAYSNEVRKTAQ
ncbi:MAG: hypothetical protein R3E82_01290 [Pseudomonadales bacterium]|nr:hypothetical protein [Pseudomonadales bacterium]